MIDWGEILKPRGFILYLNSLWYLYLYHLQLLGTYIRFVLRLHVVSGSKELGGRHPTWHLVLVPGHDGDDEEKEEDNDD